MIFINTYIYFVFLAVFASDVKDVREILRDYKQYDDPIKAFRENQRILKVKFNTILFHKIMIIMNDRIKLFIHAKFNIR